MAYKATTSPWLSAVATGVTHALSSKVAELIRRGTLLGAGDKVSAAMERILTCPHANQLIKTEIIRYNGTRAAEAHGIIDWRIR
jgi:hypothetical protein